MRTTASLLVVLPFMALLFGCASTQQPPASDSDPMVAPPAPAESASAARQSSASSSASSSSSAPARDVTVGSSSEPMRVGTRPAAARPAAVATGPNSCKLAGEGDSPVDKACNEGGLAAAKQAMKGLLKAGRAAGVKHECDDCHINAEDYSQLSKGADEKFARLLAATRK